MLADPGAARAATSQCRELNRQLDSLGRGFDGPDGGGRSSGPGVLVKIQEDRHPAAALITSRADAGPGRSRAPSAVAARGSAGPGAAGWACARSGRASQHTDPVQGCGERGQDGRQRLPRPDRQSGSPDGTAGVGWADPHRGRDRRGRCTNGRDGVVVAARAGAGVAGAGRGGRVRVGPPLPRRPPGGGCRFAAVVGAAAGRPMVIG